MSAHGGTRPLLFVLLVFGLAAPFQIVGASTGLMLLPGLPFAALMALVPTLAALLLLRREQPPGGGLRLLRSAFDQGRIRDPRWYAFILLAYPAILLTTWVFLRLAGVRIPPPDIALVPTLVLVVAFLFFAIAEELGWTGYATAPLRARFGPLGAALLLGMIWAVFHWIALMQAGRSLGWIAWWTLYTVAARVIMMGIYEGTQGSVFAASLFHATLNLGWQLFPVHGSHLDFAVVGPVTTAVAMMFVVVKGPRTWLRRVSA